MAGTIRPDNLSVTNTAPILSTKPLPVPALIAKPAEKRTVTAPRIDVEPLYTALKNAIGDQDWVVYKGTISQFLLGKAIPTMLLSRHDGLRVLEWLLMLYRESKPGRGDPSPFPHPQHPECRAHA